MATWRAGGFLTIPRNRFTLLARCRRFVSENLAVTTPCALSVRALVQVHRAGAYVLNSCHSTVRLTVVVRMTVTAVPLVIAVVPVKAPWIVIT